MRALIGIGANLGDREATIARACEVIDAHEAMNLVTRSSLHETSAVGGPSEQPKFLNAAAILETSLSPSKLLAQLKNIERLCGRTASDAWSARPLDLDLLLYEDRVIDRPRMQVPHRFLPFRRFVLDPACEIASEWIHPTLHSSLAELRTRLVEHPARFAFGGFPIATRHELLQRTRNAFAGDSRVTCETWHGQSLADRAIISGDPALLCEATIWEPQLLHERSAPRAIFFLDSNLKQADDVAAPLTELASFLRRRVLSDRIPYLMLSANDPDTALREVCGAISAGFADHS